MDPKPLKFSEDWSNVQFWCGIDAHKHQFTAHIYARDGAGAEFDKSNTFRPDTAGLEVFWGFAVKYRPVGFAMEATGIYHHVIADFLTIRRDTCGWDFKVVVANPADANGIPGRQKFDKADARALARYLAAGVLKSGAPVVPALEDLKTIFRSAARIERDRTALKNRIKKTLDRAGVRPASLDLNSDWARAFLYHLTDFRGTVGECLEKCAAEDGPLPQYRAKLAQHARDFAPFVDITLSPAQQAVVRQDLVELDFKTGRKALLAVEVDTALATRPGLQQQASHLASLPGLSPFSAVWLLAEVGPAARYKTARKFVGYCGCCPRVLETAGHVYSAHVSRHSNQFARTIFYQAATVVLNLVRADSALKRYASHTRARKGPKAWKLTCTIVAQKIARMAYAILRDGTPFNTGLGASHQSKAHAVGKKITVADRKLLRRAKNCLAHAGEILSGNQLGSDVKQLVAALEDLLGKERAVRGEH